MTMRRKKKDPYKTIGEITRSRKRPRRKWNEYDRARFDFGFSLMCIIIMSILLVYSGFWTIRYHIEGTYDGVIVSDSYVSTETVSGGTKVPSTVTSYIYRAEYIDKDGNVVRSNYRGGKDMKKGDRVKMYSNDRHAKQCRYYLIFSALYYLPMIWLLKRSYEDL